MSYEKQTWNKYDDLKTEEENIENGAVVTDNRMNHIEDGIGDNNTNLASHLADTNNPHKVTAAQVGLGNVQNFGLATEDEAKQGISNAKYMTPSLAQAVLSANINSIAYANSADGTNGFTTVYPNLNLLNFNSGVTLGKYYGWTADATSWSPYRAYFRKVKVTPNNEYTISANWSNTAWLNVYAFTNESDAAAVARYGYALGAGYWDSNFLGGFSISNNITFTVPANVNYICVSYSSISTDTLTLQALLNGKPKLELGSIATPYMPSASEVTTADWPKYVGFSNAVKTNKSASDYTWFPVKDSELTNKVDSHVNNKANPHAVTASQVGAYSKQEIDTKLSKAVMADDSGKVSIGTLDSNTLTVQGTKIYPNTKDGVWTVERLFDNEYRLTTVMSTGADVTSTWNSLFISSEIPHPNLPSGYTKTSWGVTLSNSNNLMWCSISGASVFRLIAGASTSAATRTVIVTVYASK